MHKSDGIEATARRVGEQVRQARRKVGLDQHEVSLVAGVSRRTVHSIEHGKPTMRFDALVAVLRAVALDVVVVARGSGRGRAIE